jgi:hypothetical protein
MPAAPAVISRVRARGHVEPHAGERHAGRGGGEERDAGDVVVDGPAGRPVRGVGVADEVHRPEVRPVEEGAREDRDEDRGHGRGGERPLQTGSRAVGLLR